jgi:hypothetical protein
MYLDFKVSNHLTSHFLSGGVKEKCKRFGKLTSEAMNILKRYNLTLRKMMVSCNLEILWSAIGNDLILKSTFLT